MSIKVHNPLFYYLTDNQRTAEVNGKTVSECLKHLVQQFPEMGKVLFDKSGELQPHFDIYVNDGSAYPEELAKPVKDGDELHLLLIIGAG
jgi:molybdopterin converting factor small subunit